MNKYSLSLAKMTHPVLITKAVRTCLFSVKYILGGSNDKIGFYQVRDHVLWLVTADAKGPLLQGSMPSTMEVAMPFLNFAQTLGNLQPHKNVLSKSGEKWIEYISFSSLTFCT